MRRFFSLALVAVVMIAAFVAGGRAAGRGYQFTGVVKSVEGDALTVEKSAKETWRFEIGKDSKGTTPKVGERVTVDYKMVTTSIERNPGR